MKQDVVGGRYEMVLFTPELLIGDKKWRNMLLIEHFGNRVKGLIIDEAHCVKKW